MSDAHKQVWHEAVAKSRGRPPIEAPKKSVTLRLDPDVVARFKAGGAGWQTRMNDALRKAMPRKS